MERKRERERERERERNSDAFSEDTFELVFMLDGVYAGGVYVATSPSTEANIQHTPFPNLHLPTSREAVATSHCRLPSFFMIKPLTRKIFPLSVFKLFDN